MMENKVSQISIEGRQTGVIGLKFAIRSIVEWARGKDDSDITAELLTRLEKRNYVPSSIEEAYRKALLREYKRYLGQDVEEEAVAGLQVVILWPGCAQCSSLESRLQHVTDAKEIGRYGVMGTPALIINRKVVAVGSVPGKKKIRLAFGCRCKNGEI